MALKDKVALVTGAASGIGEQCARKLAADGATVVVADLNLPSATKVAEDIVRSGGRAVALSMDVTNEEAVNAGIADTVSRFGSIDVLVSNAGIQIVNRIEDYAFSDWRKMMAIHLDGAFLTTKAAVRHMYASGKGGAVIYMGSVHSHEASQLKSAYVTAKHGLLGLARVVAKEGGPHGVRANVVCPGFVRTPLVDKQIPEQAKVLGISEAEVVKNVMLKDTVDGEFTSLADVANTVAFLAGFESNALTGQSVVVSHGWFMQ
ncbi:3-hydroxybutyrate dehydrogenase [Paraburkholderia sp. SIMBA_055]